MERKNGGIEMIPFSLRVDLASLYASEKWRHYHDLTHVYACLREWDSCPRSGLEVLGHPDDIDDIVTWFAWFHDVVYDPRAKNNEERSAEIAYETALKFWPNPDQDRMLPARRAHVLKHAILASKHDQRDLSDVLTYEEMEIVDHCLDIDLATFGHRYEEFKCDSEKIALEYDFVPTSVYCEVREKIIAGFWLRSTVGGLYRTDFFSKKYNEQASRNLRMHLVALRSGYTA